MILIIEERQAGISIGSLVKYLNVCERERSKANKQARMFVLEYSVIPKDNFLEDLALLDRAVVAEIHTTKSVLGSDCLNFSENTSEAKDDLILTAKAIRNRSLIDMCRDVYHKLHDEESQIRKIRVSGKTPEGKEVVLDTTIIKKIDYVEAELQKNNGVVKSSDLLTKMKNILTEY